MKKGRVVLIKPPSDYFTGSHGGVYPPFGLWAVASCLKKIGVPVDILDAFAYHLGIRDVVDNFVLGLVDSERVGVECNLDNFPQTKEIVQRIKGNWPKKIVFGGGPFASVAPELYLKNTPIDFVVIGEGEKTICDLIEAGWAYKKVRGVAYLKDGKVIINERQPPINLDEYPWDYSLIDWKYYLQEPVFGMKNPCAPIFSSRSCPFNCGFCASKYLGKYRVKSVELLEKEVVVLVSKGVRSLNFVDPTFGIGRERTEEICDMLSIYKMDWMCMTRVDILSEELIKTMADSGCKRVYFGLESFTQEILDGGGKGTDVRENIRKVELLKRYGIVACGFILLGLPGDTEETLETTWRTVKELNIRVTPSTLHPIPGTPVYNIGVVQGRITSVLDLVTNVFPHFNTSRRAQGVNLSEVSDGKIHEMIGKLWRHNQELEKREEKMERG